MLLIIVSFLFVGCGGNGATPMPTQESTSTIDILPTPTLTLPSAPVPQSVVITIGNHTDVTGMSSNAMAPITMALEDMARYYNENNLIPGVEVDVITYDSQSDPANDMSGYDELVDKGSDLIFTPLPGTAAQLKSRVEEDEVVLFTVALVDEAFEPPGWVFASGNTMGEAQAYTGLRSLATYDPDFPKNRPAKLGGTFWTGTYSEGIMAAAQEYCEAHPDQYEFVGGYLVAPKFIWDAEVEALKDCDYVFPPAPMNQFVKQYRDAGYAAKFVGADWHINFLGASLYEANLWDQLDGMLVIRPTQWWNDTGEVIELTKAILNEYRPDEAEEIIRTGAGYLSMQQLYLMFELIAETVEAVGADKFNSKAVYDTALSFSLTVDGCPHSYSETKRVSADALASYELRADNNDIVRWEHGLEWHPVYYEP